VHHPTGHSRAAHQGHGTAPRVRSERLLAGQEASGDAGPGGRNGSVVVVTNPVLLDRSQSGSRRWLRNCLDRAVTRRRSHALRLCRWGRPTVLPYVPRSRIAKDPSVCTEERKEEYPLLAILNLARTGRLRQGPGRCAESTARTRT
jgi:hypothetical protein